MPRKILICSNDHTSWPRRSFYAHRLAECCLDDVAYPPHLLPENGCPACLVPVQAVTELVQKYRSMSEHLRKVEEAVLGSVSGTANALAQYYGHWERAMFHALNALTVGGMTTLLRTLDGPSSNDTEPRAPLFEVLHITAAALESSLNPFRPAAGCLAPD